jgi:hypothetical protein
VAPLARPLAALSLLVLLAAALVGCSAADGQEARPVARRIQPAQLLPGDPVPAPTGPVVLTITGDIETTNADGALELDLATLEQIGLSEYTVDDYQAEGREATFRGPLLADVLAVAGADEDADTLHTVALNDYKADVPTSDLDAYPVLLATSVDGKRMTVERYGPLRIVYPNLDVTFDKTVYDARWVWQLRSIDVG